MINPTSMILATHMAQALESIIIALVLAGLYRTYNRNFLLQWSRSWWAVSIYLFGSCAGLLYYQMQVSIESQGRLAISAISLAAAYLHVAWLLFGMREIASGTVVPRPRMIRVLVIFSLAGIASTFIFPFDPSMEFVRFFVRVGVRSLVAGIAFVVSGVVMWRQRVQSARIGYLFISGSFVVYGMEQFLYFVTTLGQLAGQPYPRYALYLGYVDFLLYMFMGISMVLWFLEEAQARVVDATEKIQHMAYHDPLTGLPNRHLYVDRLSQALAHAFREREKVAVLYLDLDRFKTINNTLGYAFGDELLRSAAERLKQCIRDGDTVAKFGGDEFGLIVTGLHETSAVDTVTQKILASLRQPYHLQNREVYITTSIGVSLFNDHGYYPDDLLDGAHSAVFEAKKRGRDRAVLYDPVMRVEDSEHLSMEGDLRKAMASDQIVLHYQPLLDLKTGKIRGLEALVRWEHPTMGLLYPAEFLSLAETIGIGDELNLRVLRKAVQQVKEWHNRGMKDLFIAINLVARLFQHPSLVEEVRSLLGKAGIPPENLHLEVTETVAIQNPDASREVLNSLHDLGVNISIDDFGTGYSALSYLRNFPIDTLKIDQSFIQSMPFDTVAVSILEAIIAMAHSMDLVVVAEGVETEAQKSLLAKKDCDLMQGFLFSRAVPPQECDLLLEEHYAPVVPGKQAGNKKRAVSDQTF
ncbi:MAG TPA: EAL domain-containing protein [Thermoanaerobaculia bacterium]|nr:EAL domain-containing protein [Thermoanaerobaculia bacterium]HUM30010.1 EAL domain-containing protein [Thermoanaerobaculia bacterium]HXK68301.1 EAL domain-containing protein [Thermoanaerobaculia bacterium]